LKINYQCRLKARIPFRIKRQSHISSSSFVDSCHVACKTGCGLAGSKSLSRNPRVIPPARIDRWDVRGFGPHVWRTHRAQSPTARHRAKCTKHIARKLRHNPHHPALVSEGESPKWGVVRATLRRSPANISTTLRCFHTICPPLRLASVLFQC